MGRRRRLKLWRFGTVVSLLATHERRTCGHWPRNFTEAALNAALGAGAPFVGKFIAGLFDSSPVQGLLPEGDPLIDNNILTRIIQGDQDALTFAGRRNGLLTITDAIYNEAANLHGPGTVDAAIQAFNINRIADPALADVLAEMQSLGITSPARFNDISLIVAARQNGVGLVTADHGAFSAALRSGLGGTEFRIFDGPATARVAAILRAQGIAAQFSPRTSPYIFTVSPIGR